MISDSLHRAIAAVAEDEDFRPVFKYLAADVELRVSVQVRSPTMDAIRSRQAVIGHLQNLNGTDSVEVDEPVEVFGAGERVVACRKANVAIGPGTTLANECTMVFDICEGLISRLAIHYELSTDLEVHRTVLPLGRRGIAVEDRRRSSKRSSL